MLMKIQLVQIPSANVEQEQQVPPGHFLKYNLFVGLQVYDTNLKNTYIL